MWAVVRQQANMASGVAESDELFAEQRDSDGIAVGARQLRGQHRRNPVAPHGGAHGRTRSRQRDALVVGLTEHGGLLVSAYRVARRSDFAGGSPSDDRA